MLNINFFVNSAKETFLPQNILTLELELAKITFDCIFDEYHLSNCNPPKIGIISPHSFIAIWDEKLIHAELLKTNYQPHLPPHMKVDDSWLYLLRLKPKKISQLLALNVL